MSNTLPISNVSRWSGIKKWEHGMAEFFKLFTKATIRYFDHADAAEAKPESKVETKPETKPAAAPGAKSDAQKNLKSISMEDLQKKLGSSPDGLSEAEAKNG